MPAGVGECVARIALHVGVFDGASSAVGHAPANPVFGERFGYLAYEACVFDVLPCDKGNGLRRDGDDFAAVPARRIRLEARHIGSGEKLLEAKASIRRRANLNLVRGRSPARCGFHTSGVFKIDFDVVGQIDSRK